MRSVGGNTLIGRSFTAFHFAVLLSPLSPWAAYELRQVTGYPHMRTSEHFAVWWTDSLGGMPFSEATADSGLKVLESIRDFYQSKTGFGDKYVNMAVQYKTNVYINPARYAFTTLEVGHPIIKVDPWAFRGTHVLAHEFTHALQFGSGGFDPAFPFGYWFWESHANWMAHQYDPNDVTCAEMYSRTTYWYYGSTRSRYCNWQFLEYLKETQGGPTFVTRMWTESAPKSGSPLQADEDPIRAIMRLKAWDFAKFGDAWGAFALRMARYDFANGAIYRSNWEKGRPDWQMRLTRTPLETLDSAQRRYVVPDVFAPQRYAYNIVRLRREAGQATVRVAFRGIQQDRSAIPGFKKSRPFEPDSISLPGSGWRFGLVAVDTVRTTFRYSSLMSSGEASLTLTSAESEVYLVVAATPTNRQLILYDQLYYTIYRYPWMCEIRGAWPDGLQPNAPRGPAGVAGARHPNGGGFVAATAAVATTAYVGPQAMVLGSGKVQGQARLEGHAVVGGGEVRDQAVISGYAGVWAGQVYGNARIDGAAQITNAGTKVFDSAHVSGLSLDWEAATLSGSVQILGDAELRGPTADHGVFYGFVNNTEIQKAEMGANRTQPEPEITRKGPFRWEDAPTGISLSGDARRAPQVRFLSLPGADRFPIAGARDATGRRAATPAASARISSLPDGVFFLRP